MCQCRVFALLPCNHIFLDVPCFSVGANSGRALLICAEGMCQCGRHATYVQPAAHTIHLVPHPEQEAITVQSADSFPGVLLHLRLPLLTRAHRACKPFTSSHPADGHHACR